MTANGTYYLWAKDAVGNISGTIRSVTISKIDDTTPTLTLNTDSFTGKYIDNTAFSTFYQVSYGKMGGSITCKHGSTVVTRVSDVKLSGTQIVRCVATGKNGRSSSAKTITLTLSTVSFADVMVGSKVAQNDPDKNIRYIGSEPLNYVRFNNENWRVIGLFNGQLKIVLSSAFKDIMLWDNGNLNDWGNSSLATYLNGEYLDAMDDVSKSYIDLKHEWKLGGWNTSAITRIEMYKKERGTTVYSGRPAKWVGAIGLIYPSDYAYATGYTTDPACDTGTLNLWGSEHEDAHTCASQNWLRYKSTQVVYTMTPCSHKASYVFGVYGKYPPDVTYGDGEIAVFTAQGEGHLVNNGNGYFTKYGYYVIPALYLKPNMKITGGNGSQSFPYTLGI